MIKRALAVVLLAAVVIACIPAASGAGTVCFIGINDSVPLYLSANEVPYYKGNLLYVPYTVFQSGLGGIAVSYNIEKGSLVLFTRAKRLVYDLEAGTLTDEAQKVSNVNVVYKNGILFIPVAKAASHFGLTATMLTSDSGSPVLRFTDGGQKLDDATFIRKAENLISIILAQEGTGQNDEVGKGSETEPEEHDAGPATIYLAFAGEAVSAQTLGALNDMKISAAFFVTAEQIEAAPDLIRAIYAQGHHIGITAAPEDGDIETALQAADRALDRVLFFKSITALVSSNEYTTETYAVFKERNGLDTIDAVLEKAQTPQLFVCRTDAAVVLQTLLQEQAYLPKLHETTYIPGISETT
ncbi:MAG: polysaccharide deacetylase family protein [Oscillospiraceae bacterium]|nr:polysaccharide deacetylase family protein [Oscillospiraceae bacterium]